jgi:hypothetical protein
MDYLKVCYLIAKYMGIFLEFFFLLTINFIVIRK